METDEEEEEIEEEELFDEPRLMSHLDDFVEEVLPPKPKKKRSSRQVSTTTGPQPKKARKNTVEPRWFSFSVTIPLTGEDLDRDVFAPLLEDFVKNNTETFSFEGDRLVRAWRRRAKVAYTITHGGDYDLSTQVQAGHRENPL
jgi:hypothetical protein